MLSIIKKILHLEAKKGQGVVINSKIIVDENNEIKMKTIVEDAETKEQLTILSFGRNCPKNGSTVKYKAQKQLSPNLWQGKISYEGEFSNANYYILGKVLDYNEGVVDDGYQSFYYVYNIKFELKYRNGDGSYKTVYTTITSAKDNCKLVEVGSECNIDPFTNKIFVEVSDGCFVYDGM